MSHRHRVRRPRVLRTLGVLAVLAVLGAAVTACLDHDTPIVVEPEGGELFQRYVSLGNSITAGFQSGGINASLQRQAYPVLLAARAGASFGVPELTHPGCPPPVVAPLGPPIADQVCALRRLVPPRLVQNLAVPGADVSDATDPIGTGTTLNTLILGGRTQVRAMRDADPTLVSVWLGNNDALGAALSGDTTRLTPLAAFQADYDAVVAAIRETAALDVILIGVARADVIAPALQPGAYFWAIAQDLPPGLPTLAVRDNCAPLTPAGQPNPTGFNLVSFSGLAAQLSAGADPIVVDCADDAPFVLNPAERSAIDGRVTAFNAHIEERAREHGWIYVDPTTAFIGPALSDPDQVRKCQHLAAATDPASFAAAVMSSCPVDLDPATVGTFFGRFFSLDGVHPSAAGHAVIADTLAGRLEAKHGLELR